MSKKIGIVGAGSFGTAIANVVAAACDAEYELYLWGREPDHIAKVRATRRNDLYLPGVALSDRIIPTSDLTDFADAEVIFVVTPSQAIRGVADRLAEVNFKGVLVSCTKGIERGSGLRMSQVLQERLPDNLIAVLSGPSHAEEAALGMPTAVVLGCENEAVAAQVQRMVNGPTFRVYTSTDRAGIELGGALKNIFAIAAGVADGLGFGDNTKAALVTRSLVELVRLGEAMGGSAETFYGLGGLGDLMVTCFSRHSRNRSVGERIGKGESIEEINASLQMVAEGVPTTRSVYEYAQRANLEAPILKAVYGLLYEGRSPQEVLGDILSREPKAEG